MAELLKVLDPQREAFTCLRFTNPHNTRQSPARRQVMTLIYISPHNAIQLHGDEGTSRIEGDWMRLKESQDILLLSFHTLLQSSHIQAPVPRHWCLLPIPSYPYIQSCTSIQFVAQDIIALRTFISLTSSPPHFGRPSKSLLPGAPKPCP
jgi:hypothetical protein